ncbi:cysteine synthase family protein [bacterium]|nr:MAG: cysteine synthase family protein [bacterium]
MTKSSVGVWSLIGNTPVLPLYFAESDQTIWVKCEFMNPSGSIKDRIAAYIIEDAERRGILKPDSIIVECSSGNTGIAFAMVGVAKGYRVQILLSEGASFERRWLIRQLGGEVVLFDSDGNYTTGINITRQMAENDPRIFLPRQFENELNVEDHLTTTGQEILKQVEGPIGLFVSGYGTGGTLAGVGKALKTANPNCKVWAMEPAEAAILDDEMPCCHRIEGVADGFMPDLMKYAPVDGHTKVSSNDALAMTKRLGREFGLLVGTSSGANVVAALRVAQEQKVEGAIVTILCDRAERYYSTALFRETACEDKKANLS